MVLAMGFNDLITQIIGAENAPLTCDDGSGEVRFNDLIETLFAFGPCE